ncbi:MAG: ArsR family transcriptional regulator [Phycisphaerae bacterium]|nr:ArsR family transcriptional regulator [Phycisphaerae bacterium]
MPTRVQADAVRKRMGKDDGPLLVCAYDNEEKCRNFGIGEAISYPKLKSRLDSISKSKELVFFCA